LIGPSLLDKLPGMTIRATGWSTLGLLVALAASGPACKKEKKAPEGETPDQAATPAESPPGETPQTPPPGEAPPGETPPGETAGAPAGGDAGAAADEAAKGGEGAGGTAAAEMKPASNSKVSGTISFTDKDGKVEVAIDLKGLKPGEHGFHIHEKGDCSSPDAKSAGDHFNPDQKKHGAPDAPEHHAGDFGNLTADKDGNVKTTMTIDFVTLGEGPNSAVGKAVIVHEKKDDLKTQPTGDAGGRIACGVVEKK
jgi:Cu-Zn family superoxide dismutase